MTITTNDLYQNAKEGMAALQASTFSTTDKTESQKNETIETTASVDKAASKQSDIVDSYISSTSSGSSPSGVTMENATYSNIASMIQSNNQASAQNSASMISDSTSSSEDDDETTTETITKADGSVYEKTTVTDSDGNETVTMTKISDATPKEQTEHFEAVV